VRSGGDVVVVLRAESDQSLRFDRPHGARVPLHASAMGKALLAFGPEDPAQAVADLEPLERFTRHTLTAGALVTDLEATRARGYAVTHEERHDGVGGVGAPVLDRHGVARAGVAVGAVEAAAVRAVRSAASTKPMPLTKRAALTTNNQWMARTSRSSPVARRPSPVPVRQAPADARPAAGP